MKATLTILYLLFACSVFAGRIPEEVLRFASKTKFKPEQVAVLQKEAEQDSPGGILAASILFAQSQDEYRGIFRKRCAYDYEMKRVVIPAQELEAKIKDHLSGLGKMTKLEEDLQAYHYLRKTGYIFLRKDGTEFLIEKVLSSASFTGLAMARKEKDFMSFVLTLSSESYKKE